MGIISSKPDTDIVKIIDREGENFSMLINGSEIKGVSEYSIKHNAEGSWEVGITIIIPKLTADVSLE